MKLLGHTLRPFNKKKDEEFAEIHPHEKRKFISNCKDGSTIIYIPRCKEIVWMPKDALEEPPQIWKEV